MNRLFPALTVLALFSFCLSSCEFSVSTANIKEAKLTADEAGTTPATTFGQNDTVYLKVDLANAPETTKTSARWIAADVNYEGIAKDHELNTTELENGSGQLTFNLSNDQAWPTGLYRVELLLNGELNQSLEFTIE